MPRSLLVTPRLVFVTDDDCIQVCNNIDFTLTSRLAAGLTFRSILFHARRSITAVTGCGVSARAVKAITTFTLHAECALTRFSRPDDYFARLTALRRFRRARVCSCATVGIIAFRCCT